MNLKSYSLRFFSTKFEKFSIKVIRIVFIALNFDFLQILLASVGEIYPRNIYIIGVFELGDVVRSTSSSLIGSETELLTLWVKRRENSETKTEREKMKKNQRNMIK